MQKISTPLIKTDLISETKKLKNTQVFQPKAVTLERILQFASTYRAEKLTENQYIEWFLN